MKKAIVFGLLIFGVLINLTSFVCGEELNITNGNVSACPSCPNCTICPPEEELANNAPIFIATPAIPATVLEGQPHVFSVQVYDSDGDNVTIRWYLNSELVSTTDKYNFTSTSADDYLIRIVASDGELNNSFEFNVYVAMAASVGSGGGCNVSTCGKADYASCNNNFECCSKNCYYGVCINGKEYISLLGTAHKFCLYSSSINSYKPLLTKSYLSTLLADKSFFDRTGLEYAYTQDITLGSKKIVFGKSGEAIDPEILINVGYDANNPLYTTRTNFLKNTNFSSPDVQGTTIDLFNKRYIIGPRSSSSSIYLYSGGIKLSLYEGETKMVSINGKDYAIKADFIPASNMAIISVNGQRKEVFEDNTYDMENVGIILVKDIFFIFGIGTKERSSIDIIINPEKLKLDNGGTVKKGSDEASILNTKVKIESVENRDVFRISIAVASQSSIGDYISFGKSFIDPIFKTFRVNFNYLSPLTEGISIDTNNTDAKIMFTSQKAGIPYTFYFAHKSNESFNSSNLEFADASGYKIHGKENESIRLNEYVIIQDRILRLTQVGAGTSLSDTTRLEDVITGETFSLTTGLNNYSSASIDGKMYYVQVNNPGSNPDNVTITWGSCATYNNVGLEREFGWINLLKSEHSISFLEAKDVPFYVRDRIPNFINNSNPIFILKEKSSYCNPNEDYILVPTTTEQSGSTLNTAIEKPLFTDSNAVFYTLNSISYREQAVDKTGTLVEFDSTKSNRATISLPELFRWADVSIVTSNPEEVEKEAAEEKLAIKVLIDNQILPELGLGTLEGLLDVEFKRGTEKIAEFKYNFTNETANFSDVIIEQGTNESGAVKGYTFIKGINTEKLFGKTKTLYINNLNPNLNWVCIKDADISSIDEITSNCKGSDEYHIQCNGQEKNGYICTYDSGLNQYKITGLKHSGVIQINEPEQSSNNNNGNSRGSTSSSGGSSGGGCVPSWQCSEWNECSADGKQLRVCTDKYKCGTTYKKPAETQNCTYVAPEIIEAEKTAESEQSKRNLFSLTGLVINGIENKVLTINAIMILSVLVVLFFISRNRFYIYYFVKEFVKG